MKNHYLLAWNPRKYSWQDFQTEITTSVSGCEARWSISNHRSIRAGDVFFMIKLGVNPRGLVALGKFTSDPYEDDHWSGNGKKTHYAKIKYDFICDPDRPIIDIDELNSKMAQQCWSIQGSSTSIKEDALPVLMDIWDHAVHHSSNILTPLTSQELIEIALNRLDSGESISKPVGNMTPRRVKVSNTTRIERDLNVIQYTLQQAKGVCELCGDLAPFYKATNNQPYLEVHHLIHLSDGGPDIPENTVALCPNCHRRIHFASSRFDDKEFLQNKKSQ